MPTPTKLFSINGAIGKNSGLSRTLALPLLTSVSHNCHQPVKTRLAVQLEACRQVYGFAIAPWYSSATARDFGSSHNKTELFPVISLVSGLVSSKTHLP